VRVARIGSCAGVALGAGDRASSVVVGFEEDLGFRGEDEEGFRRVYLVVMRVWDGLERAKGEEMGGRTVEGLAWRRRVDWVSHVSALSRYGMVN
jgi:hypothetical protein